MVFCRKTSECPAVSEKLKSFECVHIWVSQNPKDIGYVFLESCKQREVNLTDLEPVAAKLVWL